ncbi:MAG: methyltransferase domain-containing protein [Vicinamibacterales bacterium]
MHEREAREDELTVDATAFSGPVPAFYDRFLGPTLFGPYAAAVASRLAARHPGGDVLEVACGTGLCTDELRRRLPPTVGLVATDLNEAMLGYAQGKPDAPTSVDWRTADACALPFPSGRFGSLLCQFGLMFVPDKAAALREAHRVLRPDGVCVVSVWDSPEVNRFAKVADDFLLARVGAASGGFFQVPFGYHDRGAIARLFDDAGFDATLETVPLEARSDSAEALATGFVMGTPLRIALEEGGIPLGPIVGDLTTALAALGGARPFTCPMQALVVEAVKRHA